MSMLNPNAIQRSQKLRAAGRIGATAAVFALAAPGTHAQSDPATQAPETAAVAADGDPGVEEVVVTARRREESLQRVPVSANVFSADKLESATVQRLEDLTTLTPGLRFSSEGGGEISSVSMRGMSKLPTGETLPAVVVYFAEVALPTNGVNVPTYDLQNVQVLKGPQGTLFGRNTLGGAILMGPRAPEHDVTSGYARAGLGSYDLKEFEGAVNIPLVADTLSLRLAGLYQKRDGYVEDLRGNDDLADLDQQSARASLLFTPVEGLSNTLILDYSEAQSRGVPPTVRRAQTAALGPLLQPLYGPQIEAAVNAQLARGPFEYDAVTGGTWQDRRSFGVVNTTRFDISDNVYVRNIYGYRTAYINMRHIADGLAPVGGPLGPFDVLTSGARFDRKLWSDELQVGGVAFDGKLDWIVGAIYTEEAPRGPMGTWAVAFDFTNAAESPSTVPYGSTFIESNNTAAFSQIGLQLSEAVKFNAGFRYSWDEVKACGTSDLGGYVPQGECERRAALGLLDGTGIIKAEGDAPTYTVGFDWQISDALFSYIVHRKGYRGVNVNAPLYESQFTTGGSGCSINLEPVRCPDLRPFQTTQEETLKDVEIGLKSSWSLGDVRGVANIAAFRSKWGDAVQFVQIFPLGIPGTAPDAPQSGALGTNVADMTIQGVELDLSVHPLATLSFSLNGAYVDHEVDAVNLPPLGDLVFTKDDVNRPTPQWSGTLSMQWELPVRPFGAETVFNADYYRTTSFRAQQGVPLPGYGLANFRLDFKRVKGTLMDVGVWVKNAFDEEYAAAPNILVPGFPVQSVLYGEPRIWGLDLRYSWD